MFLGVRREQFLYPINLVTMWLVGGAYPWQHRAPCWTATRIGSQSNTRLPHSHMVRLDERFEHPALVV